MTLILAGFALALRRWPAVPREERRTVALLAVSSLAIGVCYLSAVAFVPVTIAVVMFYTFPALIVFASPFVEGRRLDPMLAGIAVLALAGVVLVVGPALDGLDPRGLLLAGAASLATATQFFAAARARATPLLSKLIWVHLGVMPVTIGIGLLTASLATPAALLLAPLPVLATVLGYVAGFALQFLALARSSAVVLGIAYCAEPVVAALTAALVLGERLTFIQGVGGALVVAAIAMNVTLEQRRAASLAAETR
jgi:drug/metabolite transporter (DMT)-like permease